MNTGMKITLLILIALSFVLITGCDKTQIQEPEKSPEMNQKEGSDLSKITEETFNCRGYAVYKTNLL